MCTSIVEKNPINYWKLDKKKSKNKEEKELQEQNFVQAGILEKPNKTEYQHQKLINSTFNATLYHVNRK